MAVDADGNVWAVWREDIGAEDPYGDIYYSVNTGEGWSEPGAVSPAPGTDHQPDIAVDGAGRVWCVWGSVRDSGEWGVYASYATGVGVEEPVTPVPVTHQPTFTVEQSIGREFVFHISNRASPTTIQIYDASGRMVKGLLVKDEVVAWDGTDRKGEMLPAGIYFVRLDSEKAGVKTRIILTR